MLSFFLAFLACRDRPDVVLLTVDTLRYDHISALNSDSPSQTKNIDALVSDSVQYNNAYSPISVTGPAFTSLLTGQDIASHNVAMNIFRGGQALEEEERTITEALLEKEYNTAAFVSGFTLRSILGLNQGFSVYNAALKGQNRRWGSETARLSVRWIRSVEKGVLFLWYHSYDPHGPWDRWGTECEGESKPENSIKFPKYQYIEGCTSPIEYTKRYAKAVEFADKNVGTILQSLKEEARYKDAMIVFTSDHGESFTERDLWFDHGTTAHEEQLHVPLIIKYPQNRQAGSKDSRLISLMDIAPTIVEEARLDPLPKATGHSLLDPNYKGMDSLLGESSHCKNESVLRCFPKGPQGKEYAFRTQEQTLMLKGEQWLEYNRISDREERNPKTIPPLMTEEMEQIVQQKKESARNISWPPKKKKSKETEMLESLGYMGSDEK